MAETINIPTLDELLGSSSATDEFIAAIKEFATNRMPNDRVKYNAGSPPVKVQRTVMQLLEQHPDWKIESIAIDGASGCSDYRGTLKVTADGTEHNFRFTWDCAWKAAQVGWKSFWGDPDQQRAAQSFGYQCFKVFEKV